MRVVIAALVLILLTASSVSANGGGHTPVSICHSGNGKNFTYIEPDDNSLKGHKNHKHDVFGLSEAECLAKNATPEPTIEPTVSPTDEPTPTEEPTSVPTSVPTSEPTVAAPTPTPSATNQPTMEPTILPTESVPTVTPTAVVTEEPTDEPVPTQALPTPTAGDSSTPTPSPEQPATATPTDDVLPVPTSVLSGPDNVAGANTGTLQTGVQQTEQGTSGQDATRVDALPDTGTGPESSIMPTVLMALAGATLAASAWGIRRKV